MLDKRAMLKQAWGVLDSLVNTGATIADGLSQLGALGCVYLLAITSATGIGIGYTAAKATAHGQQDIDTMKKEYENERLKADLGYLGAKTKSEYAAFKNKTPQVSARVIQ